MLLLHLSVRMLLLLLLLLPRALRSRRVRSRGLRGRGRGLGLGLGLTRLRGHEVGRGLWLADDVRLEVEFAEGGQVADGGQAVLLGRQRGDVVCVRVRVVAMGHGVAAGRTCDGCRREHGLRRQRRHAAGSRTNIFLRDRGVVTTSTQSLSR